MRIDLYDDEIGHVSLVDNMGDDLRAVHSARVSFLRDDVEHRTLSTRDERLIQFLLEEGHTSPFEHSVITFRIRVPLFVRSQIMRHRTFSYNEVSRRYTAEQVEIYVPMELRGQSKSNLQCSEGIIDQPELVTAIQDHMRSSLDLFNALISAGVAREQCRMVLPQSLYTTFWMTGNLHNYIKFLRLRDSEHAQIECRYVAVAIREILSTLYPKTFELIGC